MISLLRVYGRNFQAIASKLEDRTWKSVNYQFYKLKKTPEKLKQEDKDLFFEKIEPQI